MVFSFNHKWTSPAIAGLCFLLTFAAFTVQAQKSPDTSGKVPIEILPSEGTRLEYITTDTGAINKLINNVALKQGETNMYCDSAYILLEKNNVFAFGNVKIIQQDGTQVQSDFLRYKGNIKKAYLKGNVSLTDGKNNLWAEELEYDLTTKIGIYTQGGTLQNDATTLSSNTGTYNVRSKDARFTGDVFVTDPEYSVTSSDLGYNTETKVVRFLAESIVVNERSELKTSGGTWDAKNEIAHFTTRSSILNEAQYIEGDKIDYNKKSGLGLASGNVYALDTAQKSTLFCGRAQYNEISGELWATIKPVMKRVNGNDSLYIRADTFFAAPIPKAKDTITTTQKLKTQNQKNNDKTQLDASHLNTQDTATADSSRPRYFIGYHHVLIFSDSLQARCDSISYSQADSTMRLMYNPVAWSRNSQITGDTILLYTDSSSIKKLFVPNNALIVSQSGPEKAKLFNQVQGKTLTGFFEENALRKMIVWPNAEALYYSQDEEDAYLGLNQAQSERMIVYMDSSRVERIVLEQDIKQTMTPMQQVDIGAAKLSRFQWLQEKRPKSIQELFLYESEGVVVQQEEDTQTEGTKQEKVSSERKRRKKKK